MRPAFGQVSNSRLNSRRNSVAVAGTHVPDDFHPSTKKKNIRSARMSLGPLVHSSAATNASRKPKRGARHSMMPTTRRQSTIGGGGPKPRSRQSISKNRRSTLMGNGLMKGDPRPLSEKPYMHQEIRNLIRFLSDHGYDHSLSPKLLLRPTGKDFQNIMQFLFSKVDYNFRFGPKYIDEVPVMFKGLMYPFNISKTALSAVGSPHTWPALLGSLTWLIELLEYDEQREVLDEEKETSSMEEDKMFFNYLRDAYRCFLCGDDEMYEKLDAELVANYEQRDQEIRQSVENIREERDSMKAKLDELVKEESSLPGLRTRKKDYESDIQKFKQLIAKLVNHKAGIEAKGQDFQTELEAKQKDLSEAEHMLSKTQERLDAQDISPADVERMSLERRRLDETTKQLLTHREELQQKSWELEMQLSRKTEDLENAVAKYNAAAARLKLIPSSAQNAQGVQFEMQLDTSAYFRGEDMISVDLKHSIRPALQELKAIAIRKTHEYRGKSLELQAQVDMDEEESNELLEQMDHIKAKLKKANEHYRYEKESMERHLQSGTLQTEKVEAEIHVLRNEETLEQAVHQTSRKINQLQERLATEKSKNCEAELALEEHIHENLNEIVHHKQYIEGVLATLRTTLQTNCQEAASHCESEIENLRSSASVL